MSERLSGSLTVALAALFAGAAIYITIAEQPARLLLDNRSLLVEWQNSYPAGMRMQGTLAIVTGLAALWAWWGSRDWRWIAGAALILANWPFTLVAMMPINTELAALVPDAAGSEGRALMERWGTLHAVRGALGILATAMFLWALSRREA